MKTIIKNLFPLIILLKVIIICSSCQEKLTITENKQSKYSELQLSLLATEHAIYQRADKDSKYQLSQTIKLIQENKHLFCSDQSMKINNATETAIELIVTVDNKDQNSELNILRNLKRQVFNIHAKTEMDLYLLYLWDFEKQMYTSTNAAINPKLDLLKWNKLVQLTECLSESWSILDHHFPSSETLDYSAQKLKNQTLTKDNLGKAVVLFIYTVHNFNAPSGDLEMSAINLRNEYIEYIGSIVNNPLTKYSYVE